MIPAKLLPAAHWAREWSVHRNTARAWLREMHDRYGSEVVVRVGKRGEYRTTQEMLERIAKPEHRECVTQEQLARALSQIWDVIGKTSTVAQ